MSEADKNQEHNESDIFINPNEIEGEIVVKFEDERVNYDKSDDYRWKMRVTKT